MNDWVDAEEELTKELCFRGTEMTNDRELLEQAAKAAGYEKDIDGYYFEPGFPTMLSWNPLTDDGDALRLAVKLGIELEAVPFGGRAVIRDDDDCGEYFDVEGDDPYAATRRAIVRAAAELGKTNNAEWIEYRGRSND